METPAKLEEIVAEQRVLSVAGSSNVKSLAGSIAHNSRNSSPPKLQSVGAASLNQAIKAIAVARTFLQANDIDFDVVATRVPDAEIHHLIQLKLVKRKRKTGDSFEGMVELRCASTTETVALAGAISNNVREGKRVRITAIGPTPIFRAVDAIIHARSFLVKDDTDIVFSPQFATIEAEDSRNGVVNAMHFCIDSFKL